MLPKPKYKVTRLDEGWKSSPDDKYKVGDAVETHVGGKWLPATITKPPHTETKNYGVRFKFNNKTVNTVSSEDQLRKSRVSESHDEASIKRAEHLPSNIDPNPKKVDPKEAKLQTDKLKSKLAVLKLKLSATNKLKNPDERIILDLENEIDIVTGQIDKLK